MKQNVTATTTAERLRATHEAVFRSSTKKPGFYYEDLGADLGSQGFRQVMVDLMSGLRKLNKQRTGTPLKIQWIGRFDHRHTSRFHRDNADPHSFLILGYEPTQVDSQVSVADFSKWIETEGMSTETYFEDPQVNTAPNDTDLIPVSTELSPFPKTNYHLLVLNNGKSSDDPALGVFDRGVVSESSDSHERVINSIMLYTDNSTGSAQPSEQDIADFVTTNKVDS